MHARTPDPLTLRRWSLRPAPNRPDTCHTEHLACHQDLPGPNAQRPGRLTHCAVEPNRLPTHDSHTTAPRSRPERRVRP